MVVVIDPGHGGKDPGAVNKNVREKDVVLGVGLKLGKYLNDHFPDVKVVFTRSTDVFVPLIERSRIANKNKADLFISIHANTCGTPSTRGTETFVLGLHRSNENLDVAKKENSVILLEDNYSTTYEGFDPNSSESYIMFELVQDIYMDQSLSFADDIQRQFRSIPASPNRGVKQAGFLVLRQSSMPSVLIEAGFISNPTEANYLKSDDGQQNIARSILEAFRKFKARTTGTKTETLAQQIATNKPESSSKTNTAEINSESKSPEKDVKIVEKPLVNQEIASAENTAGESENKNSNAVTASKAETSSIQTNHENNRYYSVQIAANTIPVETVSSNFKGLKDVRREKTDKYYRYYVGKASSLAEIMPILEKVKSKFSQAFIVSFIDGERIVYNAGSK